MAADLLKILNIEASQLETDFEKASIEGKGTSQEVSDRREAAFNNFLKKYFGFPFRIAKGNIIDAYGNRSASIDSLVLNPDHPFTVTNDEKYSVILADGVDFAIELKPNLSTKAELKRGLKQIKTVKELTRTRSGYMNFGSDKAKQKERELYKVNTFKIPSFIFTSKIKTDLRGTFEDLVDYYEMEGIKRAQQLDAIVVNKRGILINVRKGSYFHNGTEGLQFLEHRDETLAAFLAILNTLPLSAMRQNTSVLKPFLKTDDLKTAKTFHDLNARLIQLG